MLKKDNLYFGILIGIVLPAIFYGLLSVVALFVDSGTALGRPFQADRLVILAMAINVVPIRYYFVNLKADLTGRGVLLATFLIVMGYFLFIRFF